MLRLLRLLDLGEENDHQGEDEDGEGNHQSRRGCGDFGLAGVTDEGSHENIDTDSSGGVEYSTDLYKLVATVATSAEEVEHRIDHGVEHAHAEAGNEGADEIDHEAGRPTDPLEKQTDNADDKGHQGRLLVAEFCDEQTCGDTHD